MFECGSVEVVGMRSVSDDICNMSDDDDDKRDTSLVPGASWPAAPDREQLRSTHNANVITTETNTQRYTLMVVHTNRSDKLLGLDAKCFIRN